MNDPLQQEQLSELFSHHDDTYDYIERENVSCEMGLIDGPIQSFPIKRGGTEKDLREELKLLKEVHSDREDKDYNEYFGEPTFTKGLLDYYARCKRFVEAAESDIYIVFYDDCQFFDHPLHITAEDAGIVEDLAGKVNPSGWFRDFYSEWDVLGNWRDEPKFREVWDRRKVSFAEAVERIKQMKPLPVPPPKPNVLDPVYKQRIDELLPKLVNIEDEDNAPYKLVVEQKELRENLTQLYVILAARKFTVLIGGTKPKCVGVVEEELAGYKYQLTLDLCQYDDWQGWHGFLKEHCQIADWTTGRFPPAFWDVSLDPDFAQSEQKTFPVIIHEYDAHASGF